MWAPSQVDVDAWEPQKANTDGALPSNPEQLSACRPQSHSTEIRPTLCHNITQSTTLELPNEPKAQPTHLSRFNQMAGYYQKLPVSGWPANKPLDQLGAPT